MDIVDVKGVSAQPVPPKKTLPSRDEKISEKEKKDVATTSHNPDSEELFAVGRR